MPRPGCAGFSSFAWIGRLQARIAQIQLVHDLVVLVARRRRFVAGEHDRIGPFEENNPALVLVELRVLLGIVKTVLLVRDNLLGMNPEPHRGLGLGKPDFPQRGCAA